MTYQITPVSSCKPARGSLSLSISLFALSGPNPPATPFGANAWLRVGSDGIVTLTLDRSEMGQGAQTGLAIILAEELDADWSSIRLGPMPENPAGCRVSCAPAAAMRSAARGAAAQGGRRARAMLVTAAPKPGRSTVHVPRRQGCGDPRPERSTPHLRLARCRAAASPARRRSRRYQHAGHLHVDAKLCAPIHFARGVEPRHTLRRRKSLASLTRARRSVPEVRRLAQRASRR